MLSLARKLNIKLTVEAQCAEADKDDGTSKKHTTNAVKVRVGSHSVPTHVDMATKLQAMRV